MNKTQKILLITFCILFVLLLASLFVAVGASIAKNGMQGLVGELFGDIDIPPLFEMGSSGPPSEIKLPEEAVTETQTVEGIETVPEEQTTQSEAEMIDMLFDFDMQHKPTYEDFLKIEDGMTVEHAVEILGKPHDGDAAAGSKYLTWEMAEGGSCWIKAVSPYATENPTEWSEILQPHYGGAIVSYHNCSGPGTEQDGQ